MTNAWGVAAGIGDKTSWGVVVVASGEKSDELKSL